MPPGVSVWVQSLAPLIYYYQTVIIIKSMYLIIFLNFVDFANLSVHAANNDSVRYLCLLQKLLLYYKLHCLRQSEIMSISQLIL